jgi:RNA polymerase sigma-70 factor (ECF subfamily)
MGPLVHQPRVAAEWEASVEALELIYRRRFHQFVRVAQAITRSREAAVDAVQEGFASTLRNRASYRGAGPLEAWVWRVVVNAARQTLRERVHEQLDPQAEAVFAPLGDDEIRTVIAALPERQRLVLFLRYYADLDYRAIAETLEVEVGTVGSTLNQAQATLRLRLAEAPRG